MRALCPLRLPHRIPLEALSEIIDERYDGQAAVIGRRHQACQALRTAVIALPGWGPVAGRGCPD